MPRPLHLPRLYNSNYMWRRVQIMQLPFLFGPNILLILVVLLTRIHCSLLLHNVKQVPNEGTTTPSFVAASCCPYPTSLTRPRSFRIEPSHMSHSRWPRDNSSTCLGVSAVPLEDTTWPQHRKAIRYYLLSQCYRVTELPAQLAFFIHPYFLISSSHVCVFISQLHAAAFSCWLKASTAITEQTVSSGKAYD
jgi:hypothetical protein